MRSLFPNPPSVGASLLLRVRWQVSSACAAWATHTVILKFMLYLMGIPSAVPFLETVAYAGYPFVLVCLSAFIGAAAGAGSDCHIYVGSR